MSFRFYFLFLFFTLLFLFYPGDSPYYNIFAHYRTLFHEKTVPSDIKINPIPVVNTTATPSASAQGMYVVDLTSFTPVYEKNAHRQLYPASTTKVITALVTLDLYKPDDVITIKEASTEGTIMGLVNGESITVENLLYGMLIQSGNDSAAAVAQDYGYDNFIEKMNEKAASLGMNDTHFVNPTGLHAEGHVSSPYDLSLAGRALLENAYLRKIVGIKEITISDVDYKIFHKLTNVNKLLGEIQGLGGLKTGYTEEAGENLISFYKSGDHEYLIVVQKSEDRFEDTTNIVNWINLYVNYITPPSL